MTQTGDDFTIGGMTTSLTGVSDFVANLEATRGSSSRSKSSTAR